MGRTVCRTLWVAALTLATSQVHAHAGPQVRAVLLGDDALGRVLVSNRGLLFGGASGSSWRLMCNEALGVTTSELPDLVGLPEGRMLAATSRGLRASSDGGCSWQGVEPFATTATPALAQDPARPELLYVTAYGKGVSGLYASEDAGAQWKRLLTVDDADNVRYVQVAPGRLYLRKLSLEGMRFVYSLWSSRDAGESWESQPVELTADETDFVLLGVSPADPDLVIAKAEAANPGAVPERLLVSRDAGRSFESPWSARSIHAVEWSRDGASMWVASDEGLFRSSDAARTLERVGPAEFVTCLKQSEQGLLLCGYFRGGSAGMPGVGRSADGGATTEPWMLMTDVTEPVTCDASAPTTSTCAPFWADWKREILDLAPQPPAAGAPAAPHAGVSAHDAARSSAGCTVVASRRTSPAMLGVLFAMVGVARVRRRRGPCVRAAERP